MKTYIPHRAGDGSGAESSKLVAPSASKGGEASNTQSPRLLDQVRDKIRTRHYSIRTEQAYVDWIKRFILFHDKKHPKDMGAPEVEQFLTHLAGKRGQVLHSSM